MYFLSTLVLLFMHRMTKDKKRMNTYPTVSQATGVARTLSKHLSCTIVVYRTPQAKFVTARTTDRVAGNIESIYRNGYCTPTLLSGSR